MRRFLIMISLLVLSVGCNGQGATLMKGKLVYAPGNGIYQFDLATRTEKLLVNEYDPQRRLTDLGAGRLLIDSYDRSKGISVFDYSSLRFRPLRLGNGPVYMPKHGKFFYFHGHLYVANLDSPIQSTRKIAEGEFSYAHVIPVSDDEAVFPIAGDAGKTPPYRYNLVTNKLDQLPFTRQCTPYAWRSASKQVLCGVDGTGEYYLVGLDGQRMTPVDLSSLPSKTPVPLLYIPKYDVLILTVAHTKWLGRNAGERFDLWVYSFKDGRSEKLLEDNAPGRGGIVWVNQ